MRRPVINNVGAFFIRASVIVVVVLVAAQAAWSADLGGNGASVFGLADGDDISGVSLAAEGSEVSVATSGPALVDDLRSGSVASKALISLIPAFSEHALPVDQKMVPTPDRSGAGSENNLSIKAPLETGSGISDEVSPAQAGHADEASSLYVSSDLAQRYAATERTPRPLMPTPQVRYFSGQALALQFNVELADFMYYISPRVPSRSWLDYRDPSVGHVEMLAYEQGQVYDLYFTEAWTEDGSRLDRVYRLQVVTPPPVRVVDNWPWSGSVGIDLHARPSITFSEPVADREAAERAIATTPEVRVVYTWTSDNQVEIAPAGGWPYESVITITVRGGPTGVIGTSGGYLEDTYEMYFLTRPNKIIDVNLTKQLVTLYEGDEAVFSSPASTGVRGAETPTGEFTVLYKIASTRMQGVNPSGSRYDIPNVPWVLAFWGDYAIHGAPWRSTFGYPQSNGCVSLPTAASKFVYDWAPPGTLIRIYY